MAPVPRCEGPRFSSVKWGQPSSLGPPRRGLWAGAAGVVGILGLGASGIWQVMGLKVWPAPGPTLLEGREQVRVGLC